jgi:hypothetical protein
MDADERKEVSARMKRYWANWHAARAQGQEQGGAVTDSPLANEVAEGLVRRSLRPEVPVN